MLIEFTTLFIINDNSHKYMLAIIITLSSLKEVDPDLYLKCLLFKS